MALHDIHSCSKIVAENSELRQKIKWFVKKKETLQQEVEDLTQRLENGESICSHCSKVSQREIGIQTESKSFPLKSSSSFSCQRKKPSTEAADADVLKINKVIEMHSQLLKRYDKEVQLNMKYADTISDLNVRLSECEKRLREAKETSFKLERDLILWKARRKGQLSEDSVLNDTVLRDVVRERNKLAKENKEMKKELKSLDASFFDEVEDVKFALKQSLEQNEKYEKYLKRLCQQFGVPFLPEKTLLIKPG